MRFEAYITEKFFNAFKDDGETKEIFVNPSKKELRELFSAGDNYVSVGFICDLIDDKIYYFLRKGIIHQDAFNHIKPGKRLYKDSRWLTGEFQIFGGKMQNVNFNSFKSFTDHDVKREAISSDWSFFDKWIPNIDKELHDYFRNFIKFEMKDVG